MTSDITSSIQISNTEFFEMLLPFLTVGKPIKINVIGFSMRPFIANGDQVILSPYVAEDLKIGRIVLATYNGKFVLHRIVKIKGEKFFLAGDGNTHQIEIVNSSDIKAIVIVALRCDRNLHINTKINIRLSLMWYYVRPLRRIWRKLTQTM